MRHTHILPECYADTVLVEMLGFTKPTHKLGIGAVKNSLVKDFKKGFAVGIIDNDKKKPNDFNEFKLVEEKEGVKKFIRGKHTILVICPAFEDWIYRNAEDKGVDPVNYGFRTRKYFRTMSKKVDASKNQDLKQFLNTLKQKEAPGFTQLKKWICEGAGIEASDFINCDLV